VVKKQKEDFLQPHTWQEKEVFSIYTHSACHGRSVEKIGEPDDRNTSYFLPIIQSQAFKTPIAKECFVKSLEKGSFKGLDKE
jgi:hypothetical protein